MKDVVSINEREFISVRRASEITKYSKDYIGQLCRERKISARMIGRTWFVDQGSILNYKKSTDSIYASSKISTSIEVDESAIIVDDGISNRTTDVTPVSSDVSYSYDNKPALPTLKKAGPVVHLENSNTHRSEIGESVSRIRSRTQGLFRSYNTNRFTFLSARTAVIALCLVGISGLTFAGLRSSESGFASRVVGSLMGYHGINDDVFVPSNDLSANISDAWKSVGCAFGSMFGKGCVVTDVSAYATVITRKSDTSEVSEPSKQIATIKPPVQQTVIERIVTQPQTTIIDRVNPLLGEQIADLERRFVLEQIHSRLQVDAIYDSMVNSGGGSSGSDISQSDLDAVQALIPSAGGINGSIQFNSSDAFTGSSSLVWDNTSGRLGVATSSPSYTLDIAGDVNFTGSIYQDGIAFGGGGSGTVNVGTQNQLAYYVSNGNVVGGIATSSLGLPTFSTLDSYLALSDWYATTTDGLDQGSTNLYYADSLARASISETITGIDYSSGTGVFSLTSGYSVPLTASSTEWDSAYANRITSATSPLSISNNVISISTAGDWSGTFDGQEGNYYLDASNLTDFGTPFYQYFSATNTDALAEGSNLYYTDSRVLTYLDSLSKGYFFSTTSVAYWDSIQSRWATTSSDYWLSTKTTDDLSEGSNLYFTDARVGSYISGSSTVPHIGGSAYGDLIFWDGSAWQNIATSSLGIVTSNYEDSDVNSYIHASTTIPKIYTVNTFTALQNFTNASSTLFSSSYASTTQLFAGALNIGSLTGPLQAVDGLVSASSTISSVFGGTGYSSYSQGDILYANSDGVLTRLPVGSNGLVLKLSGGVPTWQTDLTTSGGGGSSAWSTTTDSLAVYPTDTTNVILVGTNATTTTGNIFEVFGNSKFGGDVSITGSLNVGSLNGPLQANNGLVSATTSIGVLYGGTGLTSAPSYGQLLLGNASGGYTLTATSSLGLASAFTTTYPLQLSSNILSLAFGTTTANTWSAHNIFSSLFSTNASTTNATTSNLAITDLTDSLLATDGEGNVVATSTLSTGYLSGSLGSVNGTTFNAGDSIVVTAASSTILTDNNTWGGSNTFTNAPTLGSLSGLVGANSGTLYQIATSTNFVTSLQQTYGSAQTGALTFATSSASSFNGLTISNSITNSGSTFTFAPPSITGTLTATGGGTGISNPTSAGILLGSYAGGDWQQVATSSLGLPTFSSLDSYLTLSGWYATTTDALSQGSTNLYYSDTLVNSYIHASTTIPKTYTSNTFTGDQTFNGSNIFGGSATFNSTLTLGSLNGPLQANNGLVSATTSIGVLYGGTGLTSAPSYGQLLLGNASGGYTLTATSSLGLGNNTFLGLSDTQSSYTANRILHTNSGGTALTDTAGFVFDGTNLGIGTTTPWRALSVNGDSDLGNNALAGYFTATSTTATSYFQGNLQVDRNALFEVSDSDQGFVIYDTPDGENAIRINGDLMYVLFGENNIGYKVGIGTSTPDHLLTIGGEAYASYFNSDSLTATSSFRNIRNGEVVLEHKDGSITSIVATTSSAVGRGTALLTALSDAWHGDIIRLASTTYDISDAIINLNPKSLSLIGSGKYQTELYGSSTSKIIQAGYNSVVKNLSVIAVGNDNLVETQIPIGSQGADIGNVEIENVYINGKTDGIFIDGYGTTTIRNVTIDTLYDGIIISPNVGGSSHVNIYNSIIRNNETTSNTTRGIIARGDTIVNSYNNGISILDTDATTRAAYVSTELSGVPGVLNIYGGTSYSVSGALDLLQTGSATLNVSSDFIYDSENVGGTINRLSIWGGDVANSGGNVGIGTTSPYAKLSVVGETVSSYFTATTTATSTFPNLFATNARISGNLYDGSNSTGSNGYILQSTGSATQWVATSSLGLAFTSITGTLGVSQGGTGASSFGQGWIYSDGGTNSLSASTSPTVNYITATSTTATSTFAYDLSVIGALKVARSDGSVVIGDVTGNARGISAIDVQSGRSNASNVASGITSAVFGYDNLASGLGSSAVGVSNISSASSASFAFGGSNMASGDNSSAFGNNNTASETEASAFGYFNTASGNSSSAFGYGNTTSALNSSAFGTGITNAIANSAMLGPSNTAKLTVLSTGETQAEYFTATSTTASTFPYASTTVLTSTGSAYLSTNTGAVYIGTTTTATSTTKLALAGGNFIHTASGNPVQVGSYDTGDYANNVFISGKYAYVADNASGLQIIDISNPVSPSLVGAYDTSGSAYSVFVSGKYAYVADYTSGIQIIDVSNPASPTLIGTYDTIAAVSVYVSGKYAYIADLISGLNIIDISNPILPTLLGSYAATDVVHNVYVSGKYAYVADGGSGLQIIDVSNPASPSLVGTYDTSGTARGVYVSGRYAYVADTAVGIRIIDVSNPASPSLVGTYDTSSTARGVYISGKYAYVADGGSGLQIIDVSNPASPLLVGGYGTSGTASGIFISGKYAYVADGLSGLQIIDINGIETPAIYAGNIETNVLNATENIIVGGDVYAQGGLNVGISGIFSRGTISAFVASTTQTNPVVANFMGGNVGIGTTSPYARLSVVGETVSEYFTATSTTATSTFAGNVHIGNNLQVGNSSIYIRSAATSTFDGGIDLSAGCFAVNGTCLTNSTYGDSDVNSYIHASTTIPKTYTSNTFTGDQTFNGSNIFGGSATFNSTLTLGSLNGPLQANNGLVSATTSIGVLYGGTGLTSAPSYGQLLLGNASGGYTLTATSSLGLASAFTTTYPLQLSSNILSLAFGTTTANTWSAHNIFSSLFSTNASTTNATTSNLAITDRLLIAPVILIKPDGTQIPYGQGATTDSARGTAMVSAQSAAASGDFIEVYSDASISTSLGKDGIDWWFAPGVVVTAVNVSTFSDGGSSMSFNVGGEGIFVSNRDVTNTSNVGSYVVISAQRLTSTASALYATINGTAGTQIIHATEKIESTGYDAILSDIDELYIETPILYGFDNAIEMADVNGTSTIIVNQLIAGSEVINSGFKGHIWAQEIRTEGSSQTILFSGGDAVITSDSISSSGDTAITMNGGTLRVVDAKIKTTKSTSPAIYIEGDGLVLQDVIVESGSSSSYSINASDPFSVTFVGNITLDKPINTSVVSIINNSSVIANSSTGNIGIGTTSPWRKLSVNGDSDLGNNALAGYFTATTTATSTFAGGIQTNLLNVTSLTASSTFANGVNLTSGCFAVNGTCITNSTYGDTNVNSYIHASTTIPKTYTSNTFTGDQTFNGSNIFGGSATFNSTLTLGSLNGPLQANNGLVSATTSIGVLYGGTGLTSAPSYGQLLLGNASGGYTLTATSSLGLGNNTFLGLSDTQSSYTANRILHTNSAGTALTDTAGFVFDGTNLGIGTTTPWAPLSVSGQAVANYFTAVDSSATSTFAGDISFANAYGTILPLSDTATNLASVVPLLGERVYETDTGYTKVGDGSTTVENLAALNGNWLKNGSSIYYNSGNVGIGTSSPISTLDVVGDISLTGANRTIKSGAISTSSISTYGLTVKTGDAGILGTSGYLNFASGNSNTGGTSGAVTVSSGPASNLSGSAIFSSGSASNISGAVTLSSGSGATSGLVTVSSGSVTGVSGDVMIYTGNTISGTTGDISLTTGSGGNVAGSISLVAGTGSISDGDINLTTSNTGDINFTSGTTGNIILNGSVGSNVGIGTTSPWRKLSVNGDSDLGNNALAGYFTATSTTATSTFKTGIKYLGRNSINDFNIWTGSDNENSSVDALIISPETGGDARRLQIGTANKDFYSVNFRYAGILENVSSLSVSNYLGHTYGRYIGGESGQQNQWQSYYGWVIKPNMAGGYTGAYSAVGGLDDWGLLIAGQNASTVQFGVRAATSQTADLAQWQNSSGGILANITAQGNVGIGTTSPWRKLSVNGDSDLGNNALAGYFTATSTTDTNSFAGVLSVGTTTTTNKLNVQGTSGNLAAFYSSSGGQTYGFSDTLFNIGGYGTNPTFKIEAANGSDWFQVAGGTVSFNGQGGTTDVGYNIGARFDIYPISDSADVLHLKLPSPANSDYFKISSPSSSDGDVFKVLGYGAGGYVGIGTTSPWRKLSVNGDSDLGNNALAGYFTATSTTATSTFAGGIQTNLLNITSSTASSTFANGIDISAGCFAVNGTCVTGGGGSGTVGSGTTGQFPYYAANGTTLTATSSLFLSTVGNVGIGTTSPYAKLSVAGNIASQNITADKIYATSTGTAALPSFSFTGDTNTGIYPYGADQIGLSVGGTAMFSISNTSGEPTFNSRTSTGIRLTANSGQNIFRGLDGWTLTWSDSAATSFFQTGRQFGNTSFTSLSGSTFSRLAFHVDDSTNDGVLFTDSGAADSLSPPEGYFEVRTGGSTKFLIESAGQVGIGTTSPWRTLSVTGTASFDGLTAAVSSGDALCLSSSNEMVVNTGAQTCTVSSARFKNNINNLDIGLDQLKQLHPVSFKYNGSDEDRVGFLAEEVGEIDSRLIFTELDGTTPRGVRYEDMVAILVKAVQEQQIQIEDLALNVFEGQITQIATSTLASSTASFLLDDQSFIARIADAVMNLIRGAGEFVVDVFTAHIIYAERIEVQTASISNGLEMTDSATGEIYCVQIANGDWSKRVGTCADQPVENDSGSQDQDNNDSSDNGSTGTTTPGTDGGNNNPSTTTPDTIDTDTGTTTPPLDSGSGNDMGTTTPETNADQNNNASSTPNNIDEGGTNEGGQSDQSIDTSDNESDQQTGDGADATDNQDQTSGAEAGGTDEEDTLTTQDEPVSEDTSDGESETPVSETGDGGGGQTGESTEPSTP